MRLGTRPEILGCDFSVLPNRGVCEATWSCSKAAPQTPGEFAQVLLRSRLTCAVRELTWTSSPQTAVSKQTPGLPRARLRCCPSPLAVNPQARPGCWGPVSKQLGPRGPPGLCFRFLVLVPLAP